jgi:predicted nucleic acid-binding protein
VTFLDAYALIAFLIGGPASAQVRAILREGNAAIATANLAETLDVSARLYGMPIARAMELLDPLLEGPLRPVPLDAAIARRAAAVRAEHYHRSTCPISLADCVLIAAAGQDSAIATADPDVLEVSRRQAVEVVPLPSQG